MSALSVIFSKQEFQEKEPSVLQRLKSTGVVVIQELYGNEELKSLNNEFDRFLESGSDFIKKIDYSNGKAVNFLLGEIDPGLFPVTAEIYSAPFMDRITESYFGKKLKSNTTIFVVNDVVGTRHHANDLHFDVHRSLKFFIYLSDTTAENGAFFCVPGSFKFAQELRKKYGASINYENRELTRDLPFKDTDAIPMEGKAGTLIIFDTDVFHKAGTVHKGERRVMRGQSDYFRFAEPKTAEQPPSLFKRILKKLSS